LISTMERLNNVGNGARVSAHIECLCSPFGMFLNDLRNLTDSKYMQGF
jgi:hypothetical protein